MCRRWHKRLTSIMGAESDGELKRTFDGDLKRTFRRQRPVWILLLNVYVLMSSSMWTIVIGQNRDSCHWRGSGLDLSSSNGMESSNLLIRPVYLRCQSGRLIWSYPRGGLKVLFELQTRSFQPTTDGQHVPQKDYQLYGTGTGHVATPSPSFVTKGKSRKGSKEFRGCVKVDPNFAGARIYLEGPHRLHLLHAGQSDPRPLDLPRCFVSVDGQSALYIEAEPVQRWSRGSEENEEVEKQIWLKKKVAAFTYNLEPLTREIYQDDYQECRPCTKDELLQQYCQSDFVIRGQMISLQHNHIYERSEMEVKVSQTFQDHPTHPLMSDGHENVVQLHRHLKCATKMARGEFLFIGRRVLGQAKVTCAPRWTDWKLIRREALLIGSSQCL